MSNWISVEERLPENEAEVIAFRRQFYLAKYVVKYNEWQDSLYSEPIPKPTHWMELPEPPTGIQSQTKK